MMYRIGCAVLACSLMQATNFPHIELENEVLHIIDGKIMDGNKFGNTMKLRSGLRSRKIGKETAHGLELHYSFDEKKYSLQQLADLELQLSQSKETASAHTLARLADYLLVAKEDFIELTNPFLAQARSSKKQMFELINEWAQKSHRASSKLVLWGACKEGQESQIVYNHIQSHSEFNQFFEDLIYFLESLLRSCKMAEQQFLELMKQKQKEQAAQGNK